jgi:hypothetical protein
MDNLESLRRIPWLSLGLLGLAYATLGWYLSAHHIVWFVSALIAAAILVPAWKSSPLIARSLWFASEDLVLAIGFCLVVSLALAQMAIWSTTAILFSLPLLTTFLADLDLRRAAFSQPHKRFCLTLIAGLGLSIGEMIDLVLFPSLRY